jgi:hypothetical protein
MKRNDGGGGPELLIESEKVFSGSLSKMLGNGEL